MPLNRESFIAWAEGAAGSRPKLVCMCIFHIGSTFLTFSREDGLAGILATGLMPCMYLVSMFALLQDTRSRRLGPGQ